MIPIAVAYATPSKQVEIPFIVAENCTVFEAIQSSGILSQFPEIDLYKAKIGIFGVAITLHTIVQAYDRVEIYRPLIRDPKERRRMKKAVDRI